MKRFVSTVAAVDVALVRWPSEEDARALLARRGRPRLLLVEDGVDPPVPEDALEDWIRVPAPERDVAVRVETLRRRIEADRPQGPSIDDDGVVRVGDGWTTLPPVEARLMRTLIDGFRSVVSRRDLARAGWPGGDPGRNALDVHVLRLRRRIEPLGLQIRTVRSRGYMLDTSSDVANRPSPGADAAVASRA